MIIAVIATFIALISSAMCGTIDVSVSKADLKEGDSVSIIATVKLDTNDIFLYINSELNGNPIATGLIQSYNIQPYGYLIFSNRMATSKSNFDYILTINNLRTNDSVTLKINLSYMKSGTTLSQAYSSIFIDVKAAAEEGGLHGEKGTNTGKIVGIVIGVLVLVAIIIVAAFLAYRYKKSHPTSTSPKESAVLNPKEKNDDTYSHYAASTVSVKSDERKPPTQQYAELGLGGGRDGPKPKNAPSNYSQVKTDDFGYPAKGPTAQSKPSSGYMDKEDVEENDGIIV